MFNVVIKALEPMGDGYVSVRRLSLSCLPETGSFIEDMMDGKPVLFEVTSVVVEHQIDVVYSIFCKVHIDCCGKAAVHKLGGITKLVSAGDLTDKVAEIGFIVAVRQLLELTDHLVSSPPGLNIASVGRRLHALDGDRAMSTAIKIVAACNGNSARKEVDIGFDKIGDWLR